MSHKNKISLPQQVLNRLHSKAGYGRSKHQDKADGVATNFIYSFDTMKTYTKHCLLFVQWARASELVQRALNRKPRTLDECRPFAAAWLREREASGISAYTLKMERAALAKLYGEPIAVDLRQARRADIKRSRGRAARDRHFSERKNAALVNFCRCAGPRRAELAALDASALEWHDGRPYVHYTKGTKGGRERISPIIGTPQEVADAVAFLRQLEGRNHIHSAADIHSYRAEYATRVYNRAKRPLNALKGKKMDYTALTGKTRQNGAHIAKSALYYCRGDRAGDVLDRAAMVVASLALGHNRESVVGEHYIRLEETNG